MDNYSEFITINEMCRKLDIGCSTAYKLLREHKIESFKIGKVWKIPKDAVDKYIRRQMSA